MSPSYHANEDTAVLLNELKQISDKYCARNQLKSIDCHENKNTDVVDNRFLKQTREKSNLNQYWYSKPTIEVLCNAIRERYESSGDMRVAFLSTPSLFFSLSEEERKGCMLFDVSNFNS